MQMGFERKGSGGKGKVNNESKRNKRRQKKLSPVEKMFETCEEVFANCEPGVVPVPEKIEKLAACLDKITPADVDLKRNMPLFDDKRAPVITYLHLKECEKFSIGIFCLPPSSVIPLHNHPGMTVFSKLLFGTMHIKSYDWAREVDENNPDGTIVDTNYPPKSHPDGLRLAKLKVNSEFTAPCGTSILYPADGGNMHCFTAKTACAVLDVLGPPYNDPEGRHCQYYFDFPIADFSADGLSMDEDNKAQHAWLKEREKPEDLNLFGLQWA